MAPFLARLGAVVEAVSEPAVFYFGLIALFAVTAVFSKDKQRRESALQVLELLLLLAPFLRRFSRERTCGAHKGDESLGEEPSGESCSP